MNRKTYAAFRKNTTETGASAFSIESIRRLKKLWELEKNEPPYRQLVAIRRVWESVSDQWFVLSMALGLMNNCSNTLVGSFRKECKRLFKEREKLRAQLEKATKAWNKRKKELGL